MTTGHSTPASLGKARMDKGREKHLAPSTEREDTMIRYNSRPTPQDAPTPQEKAELERRIQNQSRSLG